jgi:diguanylate cyclase (GGDEF)-like protein
MHGFPVCSGNGGNSGVFHERGSHTNGGSKLSHLSATDWNRVLDTVDYAFQPIVNIHTGAVYGVEALIRRVDEAGFKSIPLFFDQACRDLHLDHVHQRLFNIAYGKFQLMPWADRIKLFYNIDSRLFHAEKFLPETMFDALAGSRLPNGNVCLEITERHQVCDADNLPAKMKRLRKTGCQIAVDDFGAGFSGTQLLYYTQPEYVKIDRFYIQNIEKDANKRMLAESMVRVAHLMGSRVVAEGVETDMEYYCCKNIGCDLLQGYLVQKPTLEVCDIRPSYDKVDALRRSDRRSGLRKDIPLIKAEIEFIDAIDCDIEPDRILEMFRKHPHRPFFPVTRKNHEAMGIVHAEKARSFDRSSSRCDTRSGPAPGRTIDEFMRKIPIVDIHTPVDEILETFSAQDNPEGLLITRSMKYVGFLSAHSLIRIIHEKKLAQAADQNPLTRLPGSKIIYEYLSQVLHDTHKTSVIVCFDFDHFKPYNDTYGFRQGDRVILLFAEMLKKQTQSADRFAGHIGGDDFFMGVTGRPFDALVDEIRGMRETFRSDVESFYAPDAIARGCIRKRDGAGRLKSFPLMTLSAGILELGLPHHHFHTPEEITNIMAGMKKEAKRLPEGICTARLNTCSTGGTPSPAKGAATAALTAA